MVNSILILVERVDSLRRDLSQMEKENKKVSQTSFIRRLLESAVSKLNSFGSRYSAIQVNLTVKVNGRKEHRIIYYTDLTQQEAIDYTRLKCTSEIIQIEAISLPVGKPIKL